MNDIIRFEMPDGSHHWLNKEEFDNRKKYYDELEAKWLHGVLFGFPEPTEEEKYLRGIHAVITEERRMVFQHDDGTFYEMDDETPTLKIPLVKINEKLTVIRGATGFDF